MRRWIIVSGFFLVALAIAPFLLIARTRAAKTPRTRIHIIQDMDNQPKFRAQQANVDFRDGRAMRPGVQGAVARGQLRLDDRFYRGKAGEEWITEFPVPIDASVMSRGQDRFNIYCAPCHGLVGEGNGMVAFRADELMEGTWVPPASYHTDVIRERPVGHLFNTITNGVRTMPAYGPQIPEEDRWAIIAYIRALQRSQNAPVGDVPPEIRPSLR